MATELEKVQAQEIDSLNEELAIRDAEIKSIVLAIVGTTIKLGLDLKQLGIDPFKHIADSGLIMKIMMKQIDVEELAVDFMSLAPLFEKYKYLVADEIKLMLDEQS